MVQSFRPFRQSPKNCLEQITASGSKRLATKKSTAAFFPSLPSASSSTNTTFVTTCGCSNKNKPYLWSPHSSRSLRIPNSTTIFATPHPLSHRPFHQHHLVHAASGAVVYVCYQTHPASSTLARHLSLVPIQTTGSNKLHPPAPACLASPPSFPVASFESSSQYLPLRFAPSTTLTSSGRSTTTRPQRHHHRTSTFIPARTFQSRHGAAKEDIRPQRGTHARLSLATRTPFARTQHRSFFSTMTQDAGGSATSEGAQPNGTQAAGREQWPAPKVITEEVEKPSLDDRQYRVIELANGLEALLVHDSETDKASAALDVGVGNFSDAEDMPGTAHAVEHLLFMGTKKYPEENAYNQYLSAHSGSSNAYTSSTSTNYFFDISSKAQGDETEAPLYGGLDRFAQFFIEPLFLDSTVDRELRAVDSENKKNLQSDTWRINQLEKSLSNPNHPFCHFSTGNLEVLKMEPEARGVNIRDTFIKFHDKYYSANQMKLVVLGQESLDVLQDWVVELFSAIPNKNLPRNTWSDADPYSPEFLGVELFVKPVMDSRELSLRFPFPDETQLYESQPSKYIGHLIGHEGPGSLMSYVKSKGWVNALSAGYFPVCAGTPGAFDVNIRLTEEGLKHYRDVVKAFFQYLSLLREAPPQEWIYKELKEMCDVDFKFKQKTPASRFTSKTSSIMQRPIPREWLLSESKVLHKFEPKLIQEAIDCLRPDNFRLTVTSQTFPGNWDQTEKWYGTQYREEKISPDFMAEIREAYNANKEQRAPQLHLPHPNQFVPTKLEVEKKDVKEPALAPKIIRNDDLARTWFKKDDTFWVPKGTLTVSFKSPFIFTQASNFIKANLFTMLVRDALEEYSYDADIAGLYYDVSLTHSSMYVEVSGYNDKLPVLLEQVLVTMRDLEIKEDRFAIIKERATRSLRNYDFQQPYYLLSDYIYWLISPTSHMVEELARELPDVTAEDVRIFSKEMLSQLRMEIHAHGNLYKEDALKLTDMIESTLRPRVLPPAEWPIQREVLLPPGCNYVLKKPLVDMANLNNALEYYLYVGSRSDRSLRARTFLLEQLTNEPAWDQLRTKEQLGYVVFVGIKSFTTTMGFRFLVQSERSAEYLEERVDAFITDYADTLANMTDEVFEGHKRSLIARRLEKPKNLGQETSRHWIQINNEYYDFDFARKDAEQIKQLTKADMIEFYNHYILTTSPSRAKLAVHIVAQAKSDATTKQIAGLVKSLGLDETAAKEATESLQKRLVTAQGTEGSEDDIAGLRNYLTKELQVSSDKIDAAVETWKTVSSDYKSTNSASQNGDTTPKPAANGTIPQQIENIRAFRSSLALSPGPQAATDISEFLDVDAKL